MFVWTWRKDWVVLLARAFPLHPNTCFYVCTVYTYLFSKLWASGKYVLDFIDYAIHNQFCAVAFCWDWPSRGSTHQNTRKIEWRFRRLTVSWFLQRLGWINIFRGGVLIFDGRSNCNAQFSRGKGGLGRTDEVIKTRIKATFSWLFKGTFGWWLCIYYLDWIIVFGLFSSLLWNNGTEWKMWVDFLRNAWDLFSWSHKHCFLG